MSRISQRIKFSISAGMVSLMLATNGFAVSFPDVPPGHWAEDVITQAAESGIMEGDDAGQFGLGKQVTRSEFSAMLVRLMNWPAENTSPNFSDVSPDDWFAPYVCTLAEHGVLSGNSFRPNDPITREEMAVMLIRALGYSNLAESADLPPFSDVSENGGFITLASDFGIITGKEQGIFDPSGSSLREESAAMLMRLRERLNHPTDWLHGFYALSSWAQRDFGAQTDGVSFGWSRLEYSPEQGVRLNTTGENGSDWKFPDGFQDALAYFAERKIPGNLAVLMNTDQKTSDETGQNACEAILLNAQHREAAANAIAEGAKDFSGVTIDFEGMKGEALKQGLNQFLTLLKTKLDGRTLYVAVHPVMKGAYFDAYDYRTIGNLADRVILMAHDYAALTMPDNLREAGFTDTPVTPFPSVYTALKAICDSETGVADRSKIALGLSLGNTAAWQLENGKVINTAALHPAMETVQKRLKQPDTQISYSETYRNPRAVYRDDDGTETVLWYEDARSIADKITLARLFGINGISVWRLGIISDDTTPGIFYDLQQVLLSEK